MEFEICDRSRPPGNTACLMLCVQSLFLRGEKKRSCFCSQKNAAHIVRKEQPLEGRDETKLENGLLSLRNVTIPAFRTYLKPLEMSLNWELTCRVLQKPYLKWGETFSSTFVFHLFLLMLMYLYLHGLTVFLGSSHANRPRNVHTKQEYDVGMSTSLPRYDSARSIQRWNVGLNHLLRSNWSTCLDTVWNLKKK